MSATLYLTSRYPVKIWNELDWYSQNEYSLSEYFDKLEDYKNIDFNNCKLEWILEDSDSVVCFNSLAAAYDFNLIFGQDRILVKTRLFD